MSTNINRYESEKTKNELISSLHYIFPIEDVSELRKDESIEELQLTKDKREGGQYLFWSDNKEGIVFLLYDNDKPRNIYRGGLIKLINKAQNLDLLFGNYFCKVFNDDIKLLPSQLTHAEIWISLRQTQFRRAIAKFSAFSTEPMVKWLGIVENSISLKYEKTPFSFCLFMTKQKEWIKTPLSNNFISFPKSLSFYKGIMKEKWLRGSMSGQTVGLAGYGHAGELFGIYSIPTGTSDDIDTLLSPHEDIIPITNLLVEGTCMILTTEHGDIYFILPNRATFYKTQGQWHYLNYTNIFIVLSKLFQEVVAKSVLRLSLNLSYERHGALIFIPDDKNFLEEIIPDHKQKKRVNLTLRETIKNLNICDKTQRKIIMSSAKIDGALVISSDGEVLDISCMIGQPTQEKLNALELTKLERFSGSRSTAAWNSSLFGTSIKVSEDGPVTIFRHGKIIAHVG